MCVFESICRNEGFQPRGRWGLQVEHHHADWLELEGWWSIFLKYHPVTSPPTYQRRALHSVALIPNVAFKHSSLKTMGKFSSFDQELPIILAGPCKQCCAWLHHNAVWVHWWARAPVSFSTIAFCICQQGRTWNSADHLLYKDYSLKYLI